MEAGSVTRDMAMCGSPVYQASGRTIAMAIGFIPAMDGPGYPTIVGDGRHFIMAVG